MQLIEEMHSGISGTSTDENVCFSPTLDNMLHQDQGIGDSQPVQDQLNGMLII